MERGRTERFQLMLEPSEIKKIDDWRYAKRVPSRAEAIRQLIEQGLNANAKADADGTASA